MNFHSHHHPCRTHFEQWSAGLSDVAYLKPEGSWKEGLRSNELGDQCRQIIISESLFVIHIQSTVNHCMGWCRGAESYQNKRNLVLRTGGVFCHFFFVMVLGHSSTCEDVSLCGSFFLVTLDSLCFVIRFCLFCRITDLFFIQGGKRDWDSNKQDMPAVVYHQKQGKHEWQNSVWEAVNVCKVCWFLTLWYLVEDVE